MSHHADDDTPKSSINQSMEEEELRRFKDQKGQYVVVALCARFDCLGASQLRNDENDGAGIGLVDADRHKRQPTSSGAQEWHGLCEIGWF
jgi:hypothetical protein